MRNNNLFHSTTKMTAAEASATAAAKTTFSPPATFQRSPWHSPVPYLFGGLAAMLGLIAFALLILACSYWKLSTAEEARDGDVESAKGDAAAAEKALPVFEEKFLVIMAGDAKPTYLATPVCSRNASFDDDQKVDNKEEEGEGEKVKKDGENALENGELSQSNLS
ncbi:protein GLUTAMINE DUMPER 5-like [Salvia hispanica]|uniref:protein GLUTAMINE DUMPER 5-like n=1 Tax=Salvia hispanica TaxID=49212 RepID=UPI0020093DA6|nr:protein GLUTAMINE DUMPER 5-like [Salvia hispanica]